MLPRKISYAEAAATDVQGAISALGANHALGLSASDVSARTDAFGTNELPRKRKSAASIMLRQLASPFIFLLAIAAGIAFATGEALDGGMIVLFTAINTILGFVQEFRAERAVETLMTFWQDKTHVLRAGKVFLIPSSGLVPGDIIRLQAGDKIPADVRFLSATNVTVDESILTGESVNVPKTADAVSPAPTDYYEAACIGFSGTALLTGDADAVVIATGKHAVIGEIAKLAAETKTVSAFEKEIGAFSGFILKLVVVTLAFVFALNVGLKGIGRIEELVLFSIALTVGVIPEALPVVSTIAMSRGALRMARRKVIVKRLSAIDDLGSIDVLCTDKTGTITQNVLHVADVRADDADECVRYALLGSSFLGEQKKQQNNAFDVALWKHADAAARTTATKTRKLAEIPFDPQRRRNTVLVESADGGRTAITRGSPEEVLAVCDGVEDELALGRHLAQQGLAGNRVIAVAVREARGDLGDDDGGYRLVGIVSFHDPVKTSAFAAVRKAKMLGVQIKILTGDSKEVAGAVANKLRIIDDPLEVMTGAEFDALSHEERQPALARYHVFARMNPKQKFAVLALLQEKNTVGFLGEGFNDAPGLKMANVGLAVEGASDVAKESADVILLNKSLLVIFDGIEEGRRTFTNTVKYLKVTLSSNFGNFYAVATASFFISFLPMLPLQILLLNLLTDFPMIAIAADSVEIDELQKPRKYDAKRIFLAATVLGGVSSLFDFATFAVFMRFGEGYLQSMWFMVSALTELCLIYSLRTSKPFWRGQRPPLAMAAFTGLAAIAAVGLPFTAFGQDVLRFVRPGVEHLVLAAVIVATYMAATEMSKRWFMRAVNGASAH
jgi:Mg2+-importing ATPase